MDGNKAGKAGNPEKREEKISTTQEGKREKKDYSP